MFVLVCSLLSGCGACSHPKDSQAAFYCAREAAGPPFLRACQVSEESCAGMPGGCFKRPTSHCYTRSAIDLAGWSSTDRTTSCFVSAEECREDHDGVGRWGPPPYQSNCHEMRPDEVPS